MTKVWVRCKQCDTKYSDKLLSSQPNNHGANCPICGSSWIDSEIIASSEIKESEPPGVIIWLV